jgi:hypothetical protein
VLAGVQRVEVGIAVEAADDGLAISSLACSGCILPELLKEVRSGAAAALDLATGTGPLAIRNETSAPWLTVMPRYYFHLAGEIPAQDVLGHDCVNDREAQEHANFIAHRIGTEKPEMVKSQNYILVTNDQELEVARAPLASASR